MPQDEDRFANRSHPLWQAIEERDLDRIRTLAADGIDVDVRFLHDGSYTALERAVGAASTYDPSCIALVETLLDSGARPERSHLVGSMLARTSSSGRQSLETGEIAAWESTFRLLLAAGFDVNAVDDEGRSAIMTSGLDLPHAVKRFLEHGLNIDLRDEFGFTALLHKIVGCDWRCVEALLAREPYVHARPWSSIPFLLGDRMLVGRKASQILASLASRNPPGEVSLRVNQLESMQGENEPELLQFDHRVLSELALHFGTLVRLGHSIDAWWSDDDDEQPVYLRATLFDPTTLDPSVKKRLAPGLRYVEPKFLPCGLLFKPEAKLAKGFRPEVVSNRAILGVLAIDTTPKPDGRRPIHVGPWAKFRDESVKICQHPSRLRVERIEP